MAGPNPRPTASRSGFKGDAQTGLRRSHAARSSAHLRRRHPRLRLLAVPFFLALCLAVPDAAAEETPSLRAWWEFQQRAFPLGHVPADAQMRALRQTLSARAARPSVAEESDRWINIGPAPIVDMRPVSGRVAAIATDPRDLQHWLIGAAQGGIWETRDAGTTWTAKTDAAPSLAMGSIAFAPSDPDIIYAGTGEAVSSGFSYGGAGILKSIDSGATWQLLAASTFAGASFSALRVDPNDARIVVAATATTLFGRLLRNQPPLTLQTGIFNSSDGGASWSNTLIGHASALEVDPGNFNRQFAAVGSYVCAAGPPIPCVGEEPPNAEQNGLYRSTDAGESWTLISGPWDVQAGGVGRVELALAPSNPDVLYVSIQDAMDEMAVGHDDELLGLWKTTNAWDPLPSWSQIDVSATDDGTGLHGYCGYGVAVQDLRGVKAHCSYDHALLVDQANPDVLYAAGVPLWKFDGTTWTEISRTGDVRNGIHVDQHTMAWASNRLLVGNDGGVWSTTDDGATWTDHNTNLAITQFYTGTLHPSDPSFALGGSQDNGFEKWTGADAWRLVAPFDGVDIVVSSSQPDTRWALMLPFLTLSRAVASFDGRILGRFPARNGIDLTNAPPISRIEKCPANEDVFISGTDNLWHTAEFFSAPIAPGPTWSANGPEMGDCRIFSSSSALDPATGGCISAMSFAASDASCSTYAFATGDGRLRRTVDAGANWEDLDADEVVPNRFVTDLAFAPADANILYVTLSGFDDGTPDQPGHVFKTSNALATTPIWLDVSPPVNLPHNAIAVDPADPQLVYVGTDMGVWQSSDGGSTWTHMGPESGMPNVAVFDMEIHATTRRPFAFTLGRGAFVIACRSEAECDDQDTSNGAETCEPVSGRCQAAQPSATATPTATRTATPFATTSPTPVVCPGDCDASGLVTVDEIITLVNIALGNAQPRACPNGIPSAAEVDVALIIQAVNAALSGCGG